MDKIRHYKSINNERIKRSVTTKPYHSLSKSWFSSAKIWTVKWVYESGENSYVRNKYGDYDTISNSSRFYKYNTLIYESFIHNECVSDYYDELQSDSIPNFTFSFFDTCFAKFLLLTKRRS